MGRSWVLAGVAMAALMTACGTAPTGELEFADRLPAPAEQPALAPDAPTEVPVVESRVAPVPLNPVAPTLQELEQPAIWPAADVVFATPEEAAADFVRVVLLNGGDPVLGDFQQGDSRSGEIVVISLGDGAGATPLERGLLSLRQLGPDDGWFVIGASSDGATITNPAALDIVPAAALTVEGEARGFEGTVVARAFPAGDIGTLFDQVITRGGPLADNEPYSTSVDLSDAMPGEVVTIVVQGDTGLGTDPSTFAAIPVVIDDVIPPTR